MSKELGDLLEKIQYKTGLSQTDIGKRINYSQPHMSAAKNGKYNPDKLIGRLREEFAKELGSATAITTTPAEAFGRIHSQAIAARAETAALAQLVAQELEKLTGVPAAVTLERLRQSAVSDPVPLSAVLLVDGAGMGGMGQGGGEEIHA